MLTQVNQIDSILPLMEAFMEITKPDYSLAEYLMLLSRDLQTECAVIFGGYDGVTLAAYMTVHTQYYFLAKECLLMQAYSAITGFRGLMMRHARGWAKQRGCKRLVAYVDDLRLATKSYGFELDSYKLTQPIGKKENSDG